MPTRSSNPLSVFFVLLVSEFAITVLAAAVMAANDVSSATPMKCLGVKQAKISYPTGNPKFSVMQPFPSGFSAAESDPFLMCDKYDSISKGKESDPDVFPVDWHPHRGMDLLSYLKSGTGRHADSLGNRGEFASPGMQWMCAGSGIEHAEGGGTPSGELSDGFQIWINVPSARKMDDPRYGTEPPENIPVLDSLLSSPGVRGRLLAGQYGDGEEQVAGPFKTVQPVQMVDYELDAGASHLHFVPVELDNCLVYVYKGSGRIGSHTVTQHDIVRFDATDATARVASISTDNTEGMHVLLFAGKMLKQRIAWHGPFVMTTEEEIQQTLREYRTGTFLKKRAAWDYKRSASKPKAEEL